MVHFWALKLETGFTQDLVPWKISNIEKLEKHNVECFLGIGQKHSTARWPIIEDDNNADAGRSTNMFMLQTFKVCTW